VVGRLKATSKDLGGCDTDLKYFVSMKCDIPKKASSP